MDMTLPTSITSLGEGRLDSQAQQLKGIALNGGKEMSDEKMREVADQFEAMIVRMMLKEMRKTVPKEGLLNESNSTQMYRDMSDDQLARHLAESGNMGLDESIYQELKDKQERLAHGGDIQSQYRSLKKSDDEKFVPLEQSTEEFLSLNRGPKFMDLPEQGPDFMPLGNRTRISTSNIKND